MKLLLLLMHPNNVDMGVVNKMISNIGIIVISVVPVIDYENKTSLCMLLQKHGRYCYSLAFSLIITLATSSVKNPQPST